MGRESLAAPGFCRPPAPRSGRHERACFVSLLGLDLRPRPSSVLASLGSQLSGARVLRVGTAAPGHRARRLDGHGVVQSLVAQASSGGGGTPEGKRMLFAGNLPWVLDSYALRRLFEPFGEVLSAQVAHDDQNDRSMGYGHVLMGDEASALKAIREMDRREVGGRPIYVFRSHLRNK